MADHSLSYFGQGFSVRANKDRFVLPTAFRSEVRASSEGQRILCLDKHQRWNCLVGFGLSRKNEFGAILDEERAEAKARNERFDADLLRSQLFGFNTVPFDDSGRFVLPDHFASLVGIGDELFFQGGGSFFFLWAPEQLYAMGQGLAAAQASCRAFAADAGKSRK